MSVLSALIPANTNNPATTSPKNSGKQAVEDFLALLDASGGLNAGDTEGSATVTQLIKSITPPREKLRDLAEKKSDTNITDTPRKLVRDDSDKKTGEVRVKTDNQDRADRRPEQTGDAPKIRARKPADDTKENDAQSTESRDDLLKKLRTKIDDLSSILSLLASLVAQAQNKNQLTFSSITITEVSIENIGQNNAGETQNALKLLLGALGSDSALQPELLTAQNASLTQTGAPLADAFLQFKQLLAKLLPQTDNVVAGEPVLQPAAEAVDTLTSQATTTEHAPSDFGDLMKDLREGLKDLRALLHALNHQDNQAPKLPQVTLTPAPQATLQTLDNSADNLLAAAATSEKAPQTNVPVQSSETPVVVPVIATTTAPTTPQASVGIQSAVIAASNKGNSDANTGEGGERPSAQVIPLTSLSAANTARTSGASSFSRLLQSSANNAPVADQVVFHIKTALKDGNSRIHIQLDPVELGKLDIRLHIGADGKTGVTVTADNKSTLDMLQKDASGLQKALADAGLNADAASLNFNLRGGSEERRHQQPLAVSTYEKSQPDEENEIETLAVATTTRSYNLSLQDGLDIKI